nr:MAG TPA: hypothetical protein [Caudoviricetes sp.]
MIQDGDFLLISDNLKIKNTYLIPLLSQKSIQKTRPDLTVPGI